MAVQRLGAQQGSGPHWEQTEQGKPAKAKSPRSSGMSKDQKLGIESRLSHVSPWFLPQPPRSLLGHL